MAKQGIYVEVMDNKYVLMPLIPLSNKMQNLKIIYARFLKTISLSVYTTLALQTVAKV